ncbi:hypothetical protein [Thauera humireducens]|uniref:hypothetical protein n=1 Tax=Thauera humireducens TaxID=1134435 RepID=UPI00311E334F
MHSHTLLVMAAILMCIVTMVLAVMWHFNRRIPGLGSWGLAYLSGFALCGLLLAHGRLHEAVFVAAVQTLTFLVAYLNLASARAYAGRPRCRAATSPEPSPALSPCLCISRSDKPIRAHGLPYRALRPAVSSC